MLLTAFLISGDLLFGQVTGENPPDLRRSDNILLDRGGSLKILTWNVHLLPAIVFYKHQKPRARGIAEILSSTEYDIIVFQEAFHKRAHKMIWKVLSAYFPYQYDPEDGGFLKYSSGLWIISKLEIKNREAITYSKCSKGTADCRARKGALFVRVEKDGRPFQVIGTHLQAKEGNKFQEVRNEQLREIRDLLILKNKEESIPFIVTGDLNIAMYKTSDYKQMLSILDVENGELSGDYKFTADQSTNDMYPAEKAQGKLIDYVLLNEVEARIEEVKRAVKIFRTSWRKKNVDLSDHYAVEAEIVY